MTYPIPKESFDDRLAIVGTAGAGKTYAILGATARLMKRGRAVLVDPLGVMWGLRAKTDGVTPSEFKPVIFGGPHGDLPLSVGAAALIGETCATMAESCILDLSELGTKAQERRFMLGFLTALYRHANKEPVHLVIDEADMFAPQKLDDKEGEAAKLLGMMETVVRRGRVKGFIPWLITQRPAVLNKNVLSQADGIVAMKLTASQDRDAVGSWIEGQADRAHGKEILALLPTMNIGEGVVWLPGRGILKTAQFPANATFDSSRTPKRGEAVHKVDLKAIDLGKLKDRLAKVEEEAKANDPATLKARVAQLIAEAAKASKAREGNQADVTEGQFKAALDRARHGGALAGHAVGFDTGWDLGHRHGFDQGLHVFKEALASVGHLVAPYAAPLRPKPPKLVLPDGADKPSLIGLTPDQARKDAGLPTSNSLAFPTSRPMTGMDGPHGKLGSGLKPALQKVLDAVAWWRVIGKDPVSRNQAAVVAGLSPKASTFSVYAAELIKLGLLEASPGMVSLTSDGIKAANTPNLATSEDIRITARNLLGPQEQRVFDFIYDAHGLPVQRAAIAEALNLSPNASTCSVYISAVARYGIIETAGPGQVKAASWLFV